MKNSFTKVRFILFTYVLFAYTAVNGQCPTSSFTVNSPVCSGLPLQITNSSTGAVDYKWDFSPGYFSSPSVMSTDTILNLSYPGDITHMTENDTDIVFISGFGDGKMHRIIYGNGPGSPITSAQDMGNFGVLYQPTDIAFFKEDSTWFGLIVDYGSNYLYRVRFGASLRNTPDSVTTVLTNVASMFVNPWSIRLVQDSTGAIFGLVGNHAGGSISILSFGNSIRNIPTVNAPIPVPGTTYVQDAILAKSCGNWYAFMAGNNSSKIIQASFGNSLLNTPTFTNIITNAGTPSDLVLIEDSSRYKLLYTDFNSFNIKKYDLGSDLSYVNPVYLGAEYFAGQNPKGICSSRSGSTDYIYVLYSSKNLQTLSFTNSAPVNTAISTDFQPTNIVFNQSGTYPITLRVSDGFGNVSSFTDTIVVTAAPSTNFSSIDKCFGDNTQFSDLSTISSGTVVTWNWDFGDSNTSTSQNPSHTYADTGSYNIKLITSSSFGCYDTLTSNIAITPSPQASFSSPATVCSETVSSFTDLSTVSAGTITDWHWNFGNGDTSIVQDPVYEYPNEGSYNINLTVTTAAGCSDISTVQINVNERPRADFASSNTCVGQNVSFSDMTTLNTSTIASYAWDFGDGNNDNAANPTHVYAPVVGTYSVELITIAVNGCADTISRSLKVNNIPTVSFSSQPTIVCMNNNVTFTDQSTVSGDTISGWLWDFGDGNYDTIQNPVHQFANAGQYTVSLIAYSPSSCPGTVFQQNINVTESPVASFAYSTTCDGGSMHFTNQSAPAPNSSIDSIRWVFNSNDSTSISDPDFTFPSNGRFPVTLTVISPEGCIDSDSMSVPVFSRPVANFSNSVPCTADSVVFTSTSTSDSISSISTYEWTFGDFASGANNYSSLQNPKHKYSNTSTYIVSLITTTNYGCKDTLIKSFTVNQSPSAQFTYSPTCFGDLMEFFNPGSSIDSIYLWDFGDNQTNQLKEPAHYYAFAGTYSVELEVTSNRGCKTTAIKQVTVSPIPTVDFITNPACVNTNYQFQDNSYISTGSVVSWNWSISGQAAPSPVQNPNYTFSTPGSYATTLTIASDIGCTKSITKTINAYALPVASFTMDPQYGSPPLDIQIIDFSSGGNSFTYDFGDGSPLDVNPEPSHMYVDTGLFTITQIVTSQYGCKDTSNQKIYVIKPVHDIVITGDSSYFDGDYFHVVGKLENRGTRDITSLQMEARLENGNTIRETLTEMIPSGIAGYYTYPFHASFLIDPGAPFNYYCIEALNPNGLDDDHPENNERCFNMTEDVIAMDPYPNPFSTQLRIRMIIPYEDELSIDITDATGKVLKNVFEGTVEKNLFTTDVDFSEYADGVYFVRIVYRGEVFMKNVVKN